MWNGAYLLMWMGGKARNWDDTSSFIREALEWNNVEQWMEYTASLLCLFHICIVNLCWNTVYLPVARFVSQNNEKQGWLGYIIDIVKLTAKNTHNCFQRKLTKHTNWECNEWISCSAEDRKHYFFSLGCVLCATRAEILSLHSCRTMIFIVNFVGRRHVTFNSHLALWGCHNSFSWMLNRQNILVNEGIPLEGGILRVWYSRLRWTEKARGWK